MYNLFKKLHISPYLAVLLSFMLVIIIGSFLLWVPFAHQGYETGDYVNPGSTSYINNLFTAASAVCVTGLTVFPSINAEFTLYGKIIIGLLIQIGGLGFIAIFTFFITLFGRKLGILDRFLVKEALSIKQLNGVTSFVRSMIVISLVIEAIGVVPYMLVFVPEFGWAAGIGKSIFNSISAFNNAGLDLLGSTSMMAYKENYIVIINTMLLVMLGGLGFVAISDVANNRRPRSWLLLTKISLLMSAILVVGGAAALYLTNLHSEMTILDAFFQSVVARTAGFSTVDVANFSTSGRFIFITLMFIGAGSLSTGGGVKTSTIYVIAKTILGYIRGRQAIGFKRRLQKKLFLQSVSLVIIAFIIISIGALSIDAFENVNAANPMYQQPRFGIEAAIFEAVSAFATVGNSFGITPFLTVNSKLVIVLLMYAGRVGPMTVMSVVSDAMNREEKLHFQYIEADMIVG